MPRRAAGRMLEALQEVSQMRPIVVATDGSPAGRRATDVAAALARERQAPLAVLVVWRVAPGWGAFARQHELYAAEETARTRAEAVAAAAADRAGEGVEVSTAVRAGDVAQEICAFAVAEDAQLIVLGGDAPPGPVVEHVLAKADRPVLVVPLRRRTPVRVPAQAAR